MTPETPTTQCPVCKYDLDFEPWVGDSPSDEICPCCGIQFGYTDSAGGSAEARVRLYGDWRQWWIDGGMRWSSVNQPPRDWDPREQLQGRPVRKRFEFTSVAPTRANVTVDASIRGKDQLLGHLARSLGFPDYFGMNWDALLDCLSDLSWSEYPEVVIDHAALPKLPQRDLCVYLRILIEAADRTTPSMLRIMFRSRDREAVATALASDD